MNNNPDQINDAERQLHSRIGKEAEEYARTRTESRELNKDRAESRKRIAEMGMRTDAYQTGIRLIKDLSDGERKDFMRDLQLVLKILGGKQSELFPEEALKVAKRLEQAKAKKAKLSGREGAPDPDTNPRSDPKSGGAGKKPATDAAKRKAAAKAAMGDEKPKGKPAAKETVEQQEQREGSEILDKTTKAGVRPTEEELTRAAAAAPGASTTTH